MKKKFLTLLCAVCFIVPCCLMLSACGHEHELIKGEAVLATCETPGNSEYYKCECGKYFNDADGKNIIEKDSWVIEATGHTFNQRIEEDFYHKSDADCEQATQYFYSCQCGEKGATTFEVGQKLGHEYEIRGRYSPTGLFQNLEEDNYLEEDDRLYIACSRENCHFGTFEDNVPYSWEIGELGEIYRKWYLENGDVICESPIEYWNVVAYTYAVNNAEVNLFARIGEGGHVNGCEEVGNTLWHVGKENDIDVKGTGEISILLYNFYADIEETVITKIYINRGNVKVSYDLTESFEDGLYRYDADTNIFYIKYNPATLGNIMLSFEIEE